MLTLGNTLPSHFIVQPPLVGSNSSRSYKLFAYLALLQISGFILK